MSTPQMIEVPVRGEIAKALVAGKGKPVVFLHGAGGLKWDSYLEELAKDYQVYAPYFPGLEGTKRSIELDLRNLWDLVVYYCDFLDALGLESIDLIGHSFGGMLAAEVASADPKRVNKLILINAVGLWNEEYPIDVSMLTAPPQELLPKLFYDADSAFAQAAATLPEDPDERLKAAIEQQIVLAETIRYIWPIPDKGLSRRIHRIRANTCIIWGEKDGFAPVQYAYDFQQKISGAQVNIVKDAAHLPHVEQLSNVLGITRSFLA